MLENIFIKSANYCSVLKLFLWCVLSPNMCCMGRQITYIEICDDAGFRLIIGVFEDVLLIGIK